MFDLLVTGELKQAARWPAQRSSLEKLVLPVSAHEVAPSSLLAAWLSIAALTDETRHGAGDFEEHERARRLTVWLASKLDGLLPAAASASRAQLLRVADSKVRARGASKAQRLPGEASAGSSQLRRARKVDARAEASTSSSQLRRAQTGSGSQADVRGGESAGSSQLRGARTGRSVEPFGRSSADGLHERRVALTTAHSTSVAAQVLAALGGKLDPVSVELIDRTLILCADHELNASTFAARVAASTGADLYACLGAALHTLSGGKHGGASARVEALLREIGKPERVATELRERFARGEAIAGFGQPLYPQGDPRGRMLFELAARAVGSGRRRAQYECLIAVAEAMKKAGHPGPNLDAGLVAVCSALKLPRGAAAALFAIGRMPGWVAHTLEQRAQHYILRPRARYVPGPQAR